MVCKKQKRIWRPDPKFSKLIRPYYDRGFPAYIAATLPMRDEQGIFVKNPNVKTYFKYWNYWKRQDLLQFLIPFTEHIKLRQRQLEKVWLSKYDDLILLAYNLEEITDHILSSVNLCTDNKTQQNFAILSNRIYLKVLKLEMNIRHAKYCAEDNLILLNFEYDYSKQFQKTRRRTHRTLIHVVSLISKYISREIVLDCQCQNPKPSQTLIKCGICASCLICIAPQRMVQFGPKKRDSF